ncbi:unnamed protein product, partial [Iphiclides podalirius]
MERERSSTLVLERRREALVKTIEVIDERCHEYVRRLEAMRECGAEAEAGAPPVGRWGAEWPTAEHEHLVASADAVVRRLLTTENYDSVSNFISLHDAYSKYGGPLRKLFGRYSPPIRRRRYTCVGLGIELIKRLRCLEKQWRGLIAATALVSCEEAVEDVWEYVRGGEGPATMAAAEKEHVMVCVTISVDGRPGVLLADPGYHVPMVITVMMDSAYPHTGWFTQSEEKHGCKRYSYAFCPADSRYVEWREKEVRGDVEKQQTSLVYVAQPYLDGVNVTERRNLVYNFRSLLARDQKGHVTAGLYFPVGAPFKDAQFTLFFDNGSEKIKIKYKFANFTDRESVPANITQVVEMCNAQMNYSKGELFTIICKLSKVLSNKSFIDQTLEINDDICRLCL